MLRVENYCLCLHLMSVWVPGAALEPFGRILRANQPQKPRDIKITQFKDEVSYLY